MEDQKKKIEGLLCDIHEKMVSDMLEDLKNPDKRSPQLYNAIIKDLERNGIDIVMRAGEDKDNPMAELMKSVKKHYEEDYGTN